LNKPPQKKKKKIKCCKSYIGKDKEKKKKLRKFILGKTMDKMRWNIRKLNIGLYAGQTKWKF